MAVRARGRGLDVLLDDIPPASGAMVMGTGIVSVALTLDGHETLSRIWLVIAAGAWLGLAVLVPARALRDRQRFRDDRRLPAALTAVAGTSVLGTRLTLLGWSWAGAALLVIAFVLWLSLMGPVLGHWSTPTVGASFILAVATESLGLLAVTLALAEHAAWLAVVALAPFALGLLFYATVLARFDFRQLGTGLGDHWVTGGALAISALTAGRITAGSQKFAVLGGGTGVLEVASLVIWVLALLWLPVLLFAEAYRPRLRYSVRRWSTVFPVGMYAACSFVVGAVASVPAITTFARVWVWVAVGVWAVVATGLLRASIRTVAGVPARGHRVTSTAG
jgi:hypothetical protein